jgi:sulfur relay (sulfurtransferase) DsrF/TusC family protein
MSRIRRLLRNIDQATETIPVIVNEVGALLHNPAFMQIFAKWLKVFVALIVALIAVNQYMANSQAKQVSMTLKYLDRYQTERVYNARRVLVDSWSTKKKEVFEIMKAPDGEARLASYLEASIAQLQLAPQIATILDFFDELQACTSAGLCDRDTAVRFFGKFAWDFRGLLIPYIKSQRSALQDDQIGSGIDYFSLLYQQFIQATSKTDPHRLLD